MEHFKIRCKHCQKEYIYCTYGNGPEYGTEKGCSMEYCAECQKAIDDALRKIPLKFRHEFVPIDEPLLLPVFQKIKSNESEYRFPTFTRMFCRGNYDNIDEYIHDGIIYRVEWDDDKPEGLHVSVDMEYDIENNKLTGKPWKTDEKDRYRHGRNSSKDLSCSLEKFTNEKTPVTPMEYPTGRLFFNDVLWDSKCDQSLTFIKAKKEKHRLCSYTYSQKGIGIKMDVKHGYGVDKKKIIFDNGVDPENLIDFVEYEYTVEGYEDEGSIQYKNIHIK